MVASARFRPAGQDRRRRHRLDGNPGLLEGNPAQVLSQLYGIAATLLWSGVITVILLKIVGALTPLRASQEEELEGLDISLHGEALQ